MEFIVTSPEACDISDIPEISLPDYLLQRLRTNLPRLGSKPWMVDVTTDCEVRFNEVEDMSLRFASALARRGFGRGDVLYYVTLESAQLFVVLLAVWRLGGATRGWWQFDPPEVYADHLQECNPKFVLVDEKTSSTLHEAITMVGRQFDVLCFGNIDGPTSVNELFQDDGSAFPKQMKITPKEDMLIISNTSGTANKPKGVLHSHYAAVATLHGGTEYLGADNSCLLFMGNFSIGHFIMQISSLYSGGTRYNIPSLLTNQDAYFDIIMKYKPDDLHMFPYIASWIARSQRLQELDLSFLKVITIGASPLDHGTVEIFQKTLPQVLIQQIYGMTECMFIATTKMKLNPNATLVTAEYGGRQVVSSGKPFPYVKLKVVDPENGKTLGAGQMGEICVNSPSLFIGYLSQGHQSEKGNEDGFFHTGDLGFIDASGNVYAVERLNFTFKVGVAPVVPSDLEALLQEIPSVQAAAIVGIPDPVMTNFIRAYIVLKPGHHATAEDFIEFIDARVPEYKRLTGGVRFVKSLPVNRNGKLDRRKLTDMALTEK